MFYYIQLTKEVGNPIAAGLGFGGKQGGRKFLCQIMQKRSQLKRVYSNMCLRSGNRSWRECGNSRELFTTSTLRQFHRGLWCCTNPQNRHEPSMPPFRLTEEASQWRAFVAIK